MNNEEVSKVELSLREKYPGIILPEDIEGHGFSFFHEIFKRNIADGKPVTFAVSWVVFEYNYSPSDSGFTQGVRVIEGQDELEVANVKKYSIDKILAKFRLDVAIKEAGYEFDEDGSLIDEKGAILVENESETPVQEFDNTPHPAWKRVLDLFGLDYETDNLLGGLPIKFVEEHFNEVSSIEGADAVGLTFSGLRLDLFGKIDHERGVIIHNSGGSNKVVEETSFEKFLKIGGKISFFKKN